MRMSLAIPWSDRPGRVARAAPGVGGDNSGFVAQGNAQDALSAAAEGGESAAPPRPGEPRSGLEGRSNMRRAGAMPWSILRDAPSALLRMRGWDARSALLRMRRWMGQNASCAERQD